MRRLKNYKGRVIVLVLCIVMVSLGAIRVHDLRVRVADYLSGNYPGIDFNIKSIRFDFIQRSLVANVESESEGVEFRVIPLGDVRLYEEYMQIKYDKLIPEEIDVILQSTGLESYMSAAPEITSFPDKNLESPFYDISVFFNEQVTDDTTLATLSYKLLCAIRTSNYPNINFFTVLQDKGNYMNTIVISPDDLEKDIEEEFILQQLRKEDQQD